ncbi:MAG: DNA polymerase I [Campylobacteraceae bacterium]|nr:DNA polymerase I [Campylobacteraceae bacterium]
MKTLTIIDTFGFLFRNYFALPGLTNSKGFPTGMLTGFANFIHTLEEEHNTDYIMFALDAKGKTFRHDIDPNYKANRPSPPEDLQVQLPVAIQWIKKMGFKKCIQDGYEADDIIASAVTFAKKYDMKVRIVTHDKDLYQLIDDDQVVIYDPLKKIEIDRAACEKKFGVSPNQIRDFLALVGDSSDNIPGVRGIGPKGAKTLLDAFDSLDDIYNNLSLVANPRSKTLLETGRENAFLSRELASLVHTLEVADKFEHFLFPSKNPLYEIKDELEEYELRRILSRLGGASAAKAVPKKSSFEAILIQEEDELENIISEINEETIVAFDTETDSLDTTKAKFVGFSFAINEEKAYYVPVAHSYLGVSKQVSNDAAKKAIEHLYRCKLVGQNIKFDFKVISHNFGLKPPVPYADTMILAWLLTPGHAVGLDALAKRFFHHEMIPFKKTVKSGETFASVDLESACEYGAEDAWITLRLFNTLVQKLDPIMLDLAKDVENPFILTLAKMETYGIKINQRFLRGLLETTEEKLSKLVKIIHQESGTEFNINSFKQLGVILFETLGLPPSKKTKSGYSTDESVLEGLKTLHPVIEPILEYRELYKLKSTYLEPLVRLAKEDKESRVHTSFLQTGTSTGRLSSKEPNLQNIPVRTELGRAVREGFVAEKGYTLVGIDYSQIELRLLAHFSQDSALVEAFKADKDIHNQTALKLFGEKEAEEKRAVAKTINFGLLYGMGARKLAQTLGIDTKEAKGYMDSYFALFPSVKNYFHFIQENSKSLGYVETLLGRRRYFDYANATPMLLASYERESVNTVFQGSAADLIKLAMLRLEKELLNENARLLLQIHDELIFEVKEDEAKDFASKAKDLMERIHTLNVPLKTSVMIGEHWGALK